MHGAYFPGYLGSDKFRVCHRVCHQLKSFWAEGASRAPDPEPTGISEACVAGAQGLGGDGGGWGGRITGHVGSLEVSPEEGQSDFSYHV